MNALKLKQLSIVTVCALAASAAFADEPIVTVISPSTSDVIANVSYPTVETISFKIEHAPLSDLQAMTISYTLNGGPSVVIANPGNVFAEQTSQCVTSIAPMTCTTVPPTGGTPSTTSAWLSVPWTVPSVGTYTITIAMKHKGETGSDTETGIIMENMVVTDYPALPAAVNNLINARVPKMPGKVRGCVISNIAKNQAYWPKPVNQPYPLATVQQAISQSWGACPDGNGYMSALITN